MKKTLNRQKQENKVKANARWRVWEQENIARRAEYRHRPDVKAERNARRRVSARRPENGARRRDINKDQKSKKGKQSMNRA